MHWHTVQQLQQEQRRWRSKCGERHADVSVRRQHLLLLLLRLPLVRVCLSQTHTRCVCLLTFHTTAAVHAPLPRSALLSLSSEQSVVSPAFISVLHSIERERRWKKTFISILVDGKRDIEKESERGRDPVRVLFEKGSKEKKNAKSVVMDRR